MSKRISSEMLAIGLFLILSAIPVHADNLLSNPSFEIVGPNGPTTTFTGILGGGSSAAQSWLIWNNSSSTTTTQLLDSTLPGDANKMLQITTGGINSGIYQFFSGTNSVVEAEAWVYVLSGQVGLWIGSNTFSFNVITSTTINQWEHLRILSTGKPFTDQIVLYSDGSSGADFFVDNMRAGSPTLLPTPNSLLTLFIVAAPALCVTRWRNSPKQA